MKDDWDAYLRSEYSKTLEVSCKACDKKFMVPAMINTYSPCANFCSKECEQGGRIVKSKDEIIEKLAAMVIYNQEGWLSTMGEEITDRYIAYIEDIKKGIF